MNAAQRPATPSTSLRSTYLSSVRSSSAHLPMANARPGAADPRAADLRAAEPGYVPKRKLHAGARNAIAVESSVKLTVNLLLAIVAATTIAKLVPYYQAQQQRLSTLETSVEIAEQKNAELRSQFDRNFDPAQTERIMQEQSGMGYPNQRRVIWSEPTGSGEGEGEGE